MPIDEIDEASWRRSQSVNLDAAFWLVQAILPGMLERRYGRIVLTTSGYGLSRADETTDLVTYSAAKAAQYGLMNGLAWAAARGVLVNAVAPVAATRIYSRPVEPGELMPEQVAPGVVFLSSPGCSASGVVLDAVGGRFGVATYDRGNTVDFGREPATPEAVAERWPEIAR